MIGKSIGQNPRPSLTSDPIAAHAPNNRERITDNCGAPAISVFQRFSFSAFSTSGFTLVELMVVIAIVVILAALIAPAFTNLKSAGDITKTVYDIAGLLDHARSYAMSNDTYVWVGFEEVDVSKDVSVTPQAPGIGRVAIAIVASRDGTRGYDATNSSLPNPAWTNYNNGANLVAISKLQRFENMHLATTLNGSGNQPPTSGNMARPYIQSNDDVIGNASTSVTPFDWPLGSAINAGQYSFQKVINFDPQGVARIQYATNTDGIEAYMEVGLQGTHGTAVSSAPNVAAIQINCMTGATRMYRP